ncbi:MAG: methylated-DNA--[protein]-cysteine S-methyltransferase [Alkalispirochaeta sp.]
MLRSELVEHILYTHRYDSPVGPLFIAVDRGGSVHRVSYVDFRSTLPRGSWEDNKYACGELEYQLDEYFQGTRIHFTVNVHLSGTVFQKTVWNRMRKIGYGTTMSYSALAQKIGRREAAQAVGNATGANPAVIVVPCHRIINANGNIGSYARQSIESARGRSIKEYLLNLERAL